MIPLQVVQQDLQNLIKYPQKKIVLQEQLVYCHNDELNYFQMQM